MKVVAILATLLVGSVGAAKLPDCTGECISKAVKSTGCSSSNSHCICASDSFMKTVESCCEEKCTKDKHESALTFATDFCKKVEKSAGYEQKHGKDEDKKHRHKKPDNKRPKRPPPKWQSKPPQYPPTHTASEAQPSVTVY